MTPGPRMADEAGLTLVELLMTITIMGLAFGVLVGGLGTAVLGSDIHRKQADTERIVRSFAEAVKTADYVPCADSSKYQSAYSAPPEFVARITEVTFAPPPFNAFVGSCGTELHEPNSNDPTTPFTNPTNAYVIDGSQTADATLKVAVANPASITLTGYGSFPAGSTVILRVAHRDRPGTAAPTVTVSDGNVTGTLSACPTMCEERRTLNITSTGSATVTYTAALATGSVTGTDSLDGIWIEADTGSTNDPGLQRITIDVKAKGRPVEQTVQVVKRRT